MAKILSSVLFTWSRRLSMICNRSFASEIKGSWNEAPICKGRKFPEEEKKCPPKQVSCSGVLSACGSIEWPKCGEPDIKPPPHLKCCSDTNLSMDPCKQPSRKKRKHKEEKPFKSMWESSGEENLCPALVPRLDDTHYEPSDKIKRVYTQTWKSCDAVIRKRKLCCFDDTCMLPPLRKRSKIENLETAKETDSEQLKVDYNLLKKCMESIPENPNTKRINKCIKIVMPCCHKVGKNIKCHRNRGHSKCMKECCPHPSFSECDDFKLNNDPMVECRCIHFTNQCETNRYSLRKKQFNIPPPLPSWPPKERPK